MTHFAVRAPKLPACGLSILWAFIKSGISPFTEVCPCLSYETLDGVGGLIPSVRIMLEIF